MEKLKFTEPKEVSRDYDKEADVLYVSFGKPTASLTLDLGSGILAHYIEETGELTGFTVLFASSESVTTPNQKPALAKHSRSNRSRVRGTAA
jgi:uncharacterized protein YuzE